jgi:SNF2 family DNA or RNA helicase
LPTLFPHQITGASFLAARKHALLADEQRCGKTAASITACDYVLARKVLCVTKASARAQWGREFHTWGFPREVRVVYSRTDEPTGDVVVIGWPTIIDQAMLAKLRQPWDVIILDECHEAKGAGTQRTAAVFGPEGLYKHARFVWCLSGTPIPNAPNDLYPMLGALEPDRLAGVTDHDDFVRRYCVVRPRRINGVLRNVIKGGKNLEELNERVAGFWLRRTQQDVGIQRPIFSTLAIHVDRQPDEPADMQAVLDAIETGETQSVEMHLGPLRRLTGLAKAKGVCEAVREKFDEGLDKVVLMAWHTDVIDALWKGLKMCGCVGIDGRTPAARRDEQVRLFQTSALHRVFIGNIQAAGEAIDLSAAAELWFVECSFTPAHMAQAAMRVTNLNQKRQALVRVCALAGSIDEAIATVLTRKVETIRTIMEH